jgi:hypothetical protein
MRGLGTRILGAWDVILSLVSLLLKRPLLAYGVLVIIATVVMAPRINASNFGLLDDGVIIFVAQNILQEFKAGNLGVIFRLENDSGRFKPLTFLYYAIPYAIAGPSPFAFFVTQWLSLIVTGIILCRAIEVVTGDHVAGVLSGSLYILSPPVFESYYTLSKSEPPMVLWLILSLFLLFKSANVYTLNRRHSHYLFMISIFFLFIAYFTKETAHAMLLASALWAINARWNNRISPSNHMFGFRYRYFVANIIIVGIYWLMRSFSSAVELSSGTDSENYKAAAETLYSSLVAHMGWYVRDFPYIFLILLFLAGMRLTVYKPSPAVRGNIICFFIIWITCWTMIMLPWRSTLEYYLLPAALGTSIIAGVGISEVFRFLHSSSRIIKLSTQTVILVSITLCSICIANGFTNGRIQITVDSVNADIVDYLAQNLPSQGTLLVNLPEPNEYVFEMGMHLGFLNGRPDVQVHYFNSLNELPRAGTLVVTPIMKNQPKLAVRIAAYEAGTRVWKSDLESKIGHKAELIYQRVDKIRLFQVAMEKTICPLLLRANVQDRIYCGIKGPTIDTRIFEYGWEVYRIS